MIPIFLCDIKPDNLDKWHQIIKNHLLLTNLKMFILFKTQSPQTLLTYDRSNGFYTFVPGRRIICSHMSMY